MADTYSDEQLRLAARLYYVDGLGQVEVARFVKVSQAKVSRLLALARERGIVRISVAEYTPRDHGLEQKLCKKFGLSAAAVIKTVEGLGADDTRRTIAHFGAPFVSTRIPADSVVAISGGRAMRELVHQLPEDSERRPVVVQAMGSIDAKVGPFDALELGGIMARRWKGDFLSLSTPAFVPDKKTRDTLLSLDQIRSVWQRFSQVDVALVGLGTLDDSVFVDRGVLDKKGLETLAGCGIVGEMCGRFFNKDGVECDSPWHDRVISIELERLRKIKDVIGVVAGGGRTEAISAAIRGGLLKSLLIDETGARALLETPAGPPASAGRAAGKKARPKAARK